MSTKEIRQKIVDAARTRALDVYRKAVSVEARAFEVSTKADSEMREARYNSRQDPDSIRFQELRARAVTDARRARQLWNDCADLSKDARREVEALAGWTV